MNCTISIVFVIANINVKPVSVFCQKIEIITIVIDFWLLEVHTRSSIAVAHNACIIYSVHQIVLK